MLEFMLKAEFLQVIKKSAETILIVLVLEVLNLTHARTHTHMHARTHTCTHTLTHTHTHTHTHTYTHTRLSVLLATTDAVVSCLLPSRLTEDREVVVFCDLHGHSRKQNVFIYGCDDM